MLAGGTYVHVYYSKIAKLGILRNLWTFSKIVVLIILL